MPKEFPFYLDKKLEHKLTILKEQLKIKDVWILLDGDEGSGKTNTLAYLLYWFHCQTDREFTLEHIYFDSDDMFNFVKDNKEGLIGWDEATLGGLSTEWWNKSQINLLKFAMTGRKKHHVFVLCIPRFDKLKEDLRIDRTHALIHMSCGRKNNQYGKFMYITRKGKKYLNRLWKKKHIRCYEKAMRMGGFGGYIPYVFNKILDEDAYEKKKDDAISNIGRKKKVDENRLQLLELKYKIGKLKYPIKTQKEMGERLGITAGGLRQWAVKKPPLSDKGN